MEIPSLPKASTKHFVHIDLSWVVLRRCCIVLFCCLLPSVGAVRANELRLAGIFNDYGVLQRDTPVPVWGWAAPGATVSVRFGAQTREATASITDGYWHVTLESMPADGKGRELDVSAGKTSVRKRNLVVGDVWLVSGQSNMVITMQAPQTTVLQEKIGAASNGKIRLFQLPNASSDVPLKDTSGLWRPAVSPKAVQSMPAIGYLFGERIQTELTIPVGIVVAATPSTVIQNWIPADVLRANPLSRRFVLQYESARARLSAGSARAGGSRIPAGAPDSPWNPSASFNSKILPLAPFAFKGVLWYQGEGNVEDSEIYPSLLNDLVDSWREVFQRADLPFIVAELAPYQRPASSVKDSARARFGEGLHAFAARKSKVWVVTLVDAGSRDDIHPARKEIPADRFARMALAKVYQLKIDAEGPRYVGIEIRSGDVMVKFDSAAAHLAIRSTDSAGVMSDADRAVGFELAGEDQVFHPADAEITGINVVTVRSSKVMNPVAVRYAWRDYPECNLVGANQIPVAPFRTDDWPMKAF